MPADALDAHRELSRAARAELLAAIRSGPRAPLASAWLQLGSIDEARGHLRRALRAFRRAADFDTGAARAAAIGGAQRTGVALRAAGKFILHADDETRLTLMIERNEEPWVRTAPDLTRPAKRAPGLRNRLAGGGAPAELLAALDAVAACGRAGELLPAYADRSLALEIEAHAARDPQLGPLAAKWRDAVLAAYAWLVAREEPNEEPWSRMSAAERCAHEGRWGEAAAVLSGLERGRDFDPLACAHLADDLGDRAVGAHALDAGAQLHEIALRGFEQYASWATAGGEGLARMRDVNRLLATLGRPPR